jgi:adenylate cyclase
MEEMKEEIKQEAGNAPVNAAAPAEAINDSAKIEKKRKNKKIKVGFPISFKLIVIFSILVICVLGFSTAMVYYFVSDDEGKKAQTNNQDINSRTSQTIQQLFQNIQGNVNGYLNTLLVLDNDVSYDEKASLLFADLCNRNDEIAFIYTSQKGMIGEADFLKAHPSALGMFENWLNTNDTIKTAVINGRNRVENISQVFQEPLICILFNHYNSEINKNEIVAVGFSVQKYIDVLSTGTYNTTFIINTDGKILIHPDNTKILNVENVSHLAGIKAIKEKENQQSVYADDNGIEWFYAGEPILDRTMFVVTCADKSVVFETIQKTTYWIILISLAVLFFAIIIIRFFSRSLTAPIERLVDATSSIEAGDYDISIKARTHDEIGYLTKNFMNMTVGLSERQRLMSSFSKFTNRVVAEKAASGELELGGVTKKATIFFSDIRSFTAMSENLKPQEVVDFLNDYMTRMVNCVTRTNGVVDKYIGDSIMAVWGGAITSGSASTDAWNAVKTALLMRVALYEYNVQRKKEGKPAVKIGCGINRGDVVGGQMGCEQRMEYTVIGDAVNLASRTEALNKPFATDILITENTYKLIKNRIIVHEMPPVHVKGKTDAIKIYAVINAIGVKGPTNIDELRLFLGNKAPDLSRVNTDEEEKKYEIQA